MSHIERPSAVSQIPHLTFHEKDTGKGPCPPELKVLLRACVRGKLKQVVRIVDNDMKGRAPADCLVDAQDENGISPLMAATAHPLIVEFLLECGANVLLTTQMGQVTAIELAVTRGEMPTVQLLLRYGAGTLLNEEREGSYLLHIACKNGNSHIVKLLLQYGSKSNARDSDGYLPLHYASLQGHVECMVWLLKHQAQVNDRVEEPGWVGATALHLAVHNRHSMVVKFLIDRPQMDIHARDGLIGMSAVDYAIHRGHMESVKVLLQAGGEVAFPMEVYIAVDNAFGVTGLDIEFCVKH